MFLIFNIPWGCSLYSLPLGNRKREFLPNCFVSRVSASVNLSSQFPILQRYNLPQNPELIVKTVGRSVDECVHDVLELLADNEIILRNIADDYGGWYSANQVEP